QQRGQGEQDQPGQDPPAPPVHVGQPAADQHQAGEHQDVAADDPLQPGDAQPEVALDRRQRDVHHVVVQVGHEGGQRHRRQHPPPPLVRHRRPPPVRRTFTSYLYIVEEDPCTLYSCQVASEDRPRLTKTAVVDQALRLADADGAEALTIRRLADQLGVTPMAIYWHFKNKEQLLSATADHVMREVRPDVDPAAPWDRRLRGMVEALLRGMRQHPSAPALLMAADKSGVEALDRATEAALELLSQAGFSLAEGFQIAASVLHDVIGLVEREPGRLPGMSPEQAAECHRRAWLALEALPADRYPLLVRLAAA